MYLNYQQIKARPAARRALPGLGTSDLMQSRRGPGCRQLITRGPCDKGLTSGSGRVALSAASGGRRARTAAAAGRRQGV